MPATIYFAVSEEMIAKNGMPDKEKSKTFSYILKNGTYLSFYIADTAGKLFDVVKEHYKEPFAICRGILTDVDIATAMTCCLNGDTNSFNVSIDEITWIGK